MRKVAVTGGLSAGKTTVCKLLKECGAYVADSDAIVRDLLKVESPTGKQVINLLGPEIITQNQIDRKKIANAVFSNPEKLKKLEMILHPLVRQEINRLYEQVKNQTNYNCFVAEVPLLYEAHMEEDFDAVIAVVTSDPIARKRSGSAEEFDRRNRFLLPQETKKDRATYVINNDGDLATLKTQIRALLDKLL